MRKYFNIECLKKFRDMTLLFFAFNDMYYFLAFSPVHLVKDLESLDLILSLQFFSKNAKKKILVLMFREICMIIRSDLFLSENSKNFAKKKWLEALGLIEEDLKKDSRVCKQHFHPSHILECSKSTQRLRLKIGAIPTMNLTKNTLDTN